MAVKSATTRKSPEKNCQGKTCKKSAAPAGVSHEFCLMAPEANEVYLAGDFNAWANGKDKLRKLKSGLHKKSKKLQPGRYEYRFIIDGQWCCDPANEQRCTNDFGEENSILEIR